MNIDVSDYLKAAFDEKYGEGNYIKTVNDEGNSVLLVNIKGIELFEIDLNLAEQAIIDEGIEPAEFVQEAIFNVELLSTELKKDGTYNEIATAMDMIFRYLIEAEVDYSVGDCVETEDEDDMCCGLWLNVGLHPVPFYFEDVWINLIKEKKDVAEYVRDIIIYHIGYMP